MQVILHAGNYFLKIKNGWTVIKKYATTLVYVGTHFFPQFLENPRPHFNACNITLSKKTRLLNEKGIENSIENLSGITDGHHNYKEWECEVKIVISALKRTEK